MECKNLSDKLRALATGGNRSATARIRERFDDIEAALSARVRRTDVHQVLVEEGINITFESFELAIYRIRKERKKQRTTVKEHVPQPSVVPTSGGTKKNPLHGLGVKGEEIPETQFEADHEERK